MEFYQTFMPGATGSKILFEKTPTYYKNLKIPERIISMNPNVKILFIVCDNVRRTISRYLHMQEVQRKKNIREEIGIDFRTFSSNLNMTIDRLSLLIKEIEDNSTSEQDFINKMEMRLKRKQIPFSSSSSHLGKHFKHLLNPKRDHHDYKHLI